MASPPILIGGISHGWRYHLTPGGVKKALGRGEEVLLASTQLEVPSLRLSGPKKYQASDSFSVRIFSPRPMGRERGFGLEEVKGFIKAGMLPHRLGGAVEVVVQPLVGPSTHYFVAPTSGGFKILHWLGQLDRERCVESIPFMSGSNLPLSERMKNRFVHWAERALRGAHVKPVTTRS